MSIIQKIWECDRFANSGLLAMIWVQNMLTKDNDTNLQPTLVWHRLLRSCSNFLRINFWLRPYNKIQRQCFWPRSMLSRSSLTRFSAPKPREKLLIYRLNLNPQSDHLHCCANLLWEISQIKIIISRFQSSRFTHWPVKSNKLKKKKELENLQKEQKQQV